MDGCPLPPNPEGDATAAEVEGGSPPAGRFEPPGVRVLVGAAKGPPPLHPANAMAPAMSVAANARPILEGRGRPGGGGEAARRRIAGNDALLEGLAVRLVTTA